MRAKRAPHKLAVEQHGYCKSRVSRVLFWEVSSTVRNLQTDQMSFSVLVWVNLPHHGPAGLRGISRKHGCGKLDLRVPALNRNSL